MFIKVTGDLNFDYDVMTNNQELCNDSIALSIRLLLLQLEAVVSR